VSPAAVPLRERLFRSLVIDHESSCLLWTLSTTKAGYGQINVNRRISLVHIVMWEMFEGPVPAGLELDHVAARGCVHRHCASIAHLEPVTHRENLLRGKSFSAVNAAATHCPALHRYDTANTYIRPDGTRECRECHRLAELAKRRQSAAERAEINRLDQQIRHMP
jgi:hypothetical protein